MKSVKYIDGELSCRIEDAIFFDDDSYSRVYKNNENNFVVKQRVSIDCLENKGWATLYPIYEYKNHSYIALTGETSWGGKGFISLQEMESLKFKWLIHFSFMNNPKRIIIKDEVVIVTTDLSYPTGLNFIIPIDSPLNFSIIEPKFDDI